jgi:hypothetical protein
MSLLADLVVVDNQGGIALPGTQATQTYSEILSGNPNRKSRRRASTALTTPVTIHTEQSVKGVGYNARAITMLRVEYQDLTADPADTGGVTPNLAATFTLNRPVNSGGAITTAITKDTIAIILDVLTRSGQLDKLLNGEA